MLNKYIDEDNSIYTSKLHWIDYLEKIYIFENSKEVKRFLVSNDDLIDVLKDAPKHIYEFFGNVPILLELHHDTEEGWDELFIIVKSSFSPKEAVEKDVELFKTWFITLPTSINNRLSITEEPLHSLDGR